VNVALRTAAAGAAEAESAPTFSAQLAEASGVPAGGGHERAVLFQILSDTFFSLPFPRQVTESKLGLAVHAYFAPADGQAVIREFKEFLGWHSTPR